jgi:tetratricopeptide (TPR) repeat protein
LNIGTIYYHKKSFNQALNFYDKSTAMFTALKDSVLLVQCMQNVAVVYFWLKQYNKAGALLFEANKKAKQLDLNETIASIDLTLADLEIALGRYDEAEKTIVEGINFATIVKSAKMEGDFKYTSYELELKRKNYANALKSLYDIYHSDSVSHERGTSSQINLIREQAKTQARQKENEILVQRQQYDRVKFFAVMVVSVLLLICTVLLVNNVKRKTKTNDQLKSLNEEVSRQKDNLDRINHHLEEIIDDRTKDLQIKNKKLSEYSSYLSHQIRGPISTLKGLMNLEKEGLVDQQECINMMNKCVSEIDEKIMEISDMLHDARKTR